ncbi:MAG: hypothetical protein JSS64_01865 [Bacteroidetes bacterium]|nr:hypothetical protein [Bacteroidota bacterium]
MTKYPTLYEFNALPEHQRFQYLWDEATFLNNRVEGESRFNLYACGDFFVEVEYERNDNLIRGLRSFKTIRNLDPYLAGLTLDGLS